MYFIKSNIRDFMCLHRDIFIVLVIIQVISAFGLFFIYGLINNYQREREDMSYDTYELSAGIDGEEQDTYFADLKEKMPAILDKLDKKIAGISVMGICDRGMIMSYGDYHDGRFWLPTYLGTEFNITQGRYFTDDDYIGDEYVALGNDVYKDMEKVNLGDREYKIIGIFSHNPQFGYIMIPYKFLPDNMKVISVFIKLNNHPTESDYAVFKEKLAEAFGEDNLQIEELYLDKPDRVKSINSINLVAVIIGIISSVNIFVVYSNLIEKRRRKNAIIQICGCSYRQMCTYLHIEVMMITIVTYILGIFIFMLVNRLVFSGLFTYFSDIYTLAVCGKLTLLYLITTTLLSIVMALVLNRREPLSLLRRSHYA